MKNRQKIKRHFLIAVKPFDRLACALEHLSRAILARSANIKWSIVGCRKMHCRKCRRNCGKWKTCNLIQSPLEIGPSRTQSNDGATVLITALGAGLVNLLHAAMKNMDRISCFVFLLFSLWCFVCKTFCLPSYFVVSDARNARCCAMRDVRAHRTHFFICIGECECTSDRTCARAPQHSLKLEPTDRFNMVHLIQASAALENLHIY